MKVCELYKEQMFLLEELTESEREAIKNHVAECQTCRKHLQEISALHHLLGEFRKSQHIDDEQLIRYGIYLSDPHNDDYDGKKLSRKAIKEIKDHMTDCSLCKGKVEETRQEYSRLETFLKEKGVPDTVIGEKEIGLEMIRQLSLTSNRAVKAIREVLFTSKYRIMPAAVLAAAMIFLVVWFGPLFRGDGSSLYNLAMINESQIQYLTRSTVTGLLNDGLYAFQTKDYSAAIDRLERYIATDTSSVMLAYAHQVVGMSYLMKAERDIWGRFRSFDQQQVDKGISHFRAIFELTTNKRMHENALWFLGKAHLMKKEIAEAKNYFRNVIQLRGKRLDAAAGILLELEKMPETDQN